MANETLLLNGTFNGTELAGSGVEAAIIAFIMAAIVFMIIVAIAAYIYMGFAYMAIARKLRQSSPGISWIPSIGPNIIAFRTSKMHWWPWLLIIGFFIPGVNIVFSLLFTAFTVIWHWSLFEKVGRPGWWAILWLIPIVNLVLIGIAAWGEPSQRSRHKRR